MAAVTRALAGFLLTMVTMACASTLKYSDCSTSSPVKVKEVFLEPDPAVSGEDMTFTMPATASTEITGGTVIVVVLFRGVPVHIERDSLCDKTSCPVAAGDDFVFTNSQPLPEVTPAGPYTVRINVLDQDLRALFCEKMQFQIVKPPQPRSLLGKIGSVFQSAFGKFEDDIGRVMEDAEKAWNMTAEAKLELKNVLMGAESWKWNHMHGDGYEERRIE